MGISVVNALSTRVDIEVRRQGFHWTQTYIDQHPTAPLKQGEPMTEGESTGTSVTFWADPKIFETTIYDFETLRSRFQQMAFLNKGLKISLTDERENDQAGDEVAGDAADEPGAKHQTVTYQYLNGIKDYVDYLVKVRKATPVEEDVISFEAEDLKLGISAELAMRVTTLRFRALSDQEIRNYIATGEPMDKAGAYGIQGLASMFVVGLDGDYYNVMGLPICTLTVLLRRFGVKLLGC